MNKAEKTVFNRAAIAISNATANILKMIAVTDGAAIAISKLTSTLFKIRKNLWSGYLITWKDQQDQIHKTTISIISPGADYIKSLNIRYIRGIRVKAIVDIKSIKRKDTTCPDE